MGQESLQAGKIGGREKGGSIFYNLGKIAGNNLTPKQQKTLDRKLQGGEEAAEKTSSQLEYLLSRSPLRRTVDIAIGGGLLALLAACGTSNPTNINVTPSARVNHLFLTEYFQDNYTFNQYTEKLLRGGGLGVSATYFKQAPKSDFKGIVEDKGRILEAFNAWNCYVVTQVSNGFALTSGTVLELVKPKDSPETSSAGGILYNAVTDIVNKNPKLGSETSRVKLNLVIMQAYNVDDVTGQPSGRLLTVVQSTDGTVIPLT